MSNKDLGGTHTVMSGETTIQTLPFVLTLGNHDYSLKSGEIEKDDAHRMIDFL